MHIVCGKAKSIDSSIFLCSHKCCLMNKNVDKHDGAWVVRSGTVDEDGKNLAGQYAVFVESIHSKNFFMRYFCMGSYFADHMGLPFERGLGMAV